MTQTPRPALIGFGANLPFRGRAPEQTIRQALGLLEASPGIRLVASSSLWLSRPVRAEGPNFINGVAEILCAQEPEALLMRLLEIETHFGRTRAEQPAACAPARTLDIDLLWMDGLTRDLPHLVLPHPRAESRAFVLAPLAELRPCLRLGSGPQAKTVEALLAELLTQDPHSVMRLESLSVRSA